jgi:heme exporter protein D
VGTNADVSSGSLHNATAIGFNTLVNASNKVRIGNAAVTVIEGQVPFTTPSDGRYKFNVREDVKGLDFIMHLRPVTYQFDVRRFDGATSASENNSLQVAYNEAAAIRRTGFIAQEVEQAANVSGYQFSGIIKPLSETDHYALSYESFVVPLVKSIQEQQLIIQNQHEKIEQQEKRLVQQQNQINEILLQMEKMKSQIK